MLLKTVGVILNRVRTFLLTKKNSKSQGNLTDSEQKALVSRQKIFRSEMVCKKGVLKNLVNFTGKNVCCSLFLITL